MNIEYFKNIYFENKEVKNHVRNFINEMTCKKLFERFYK